MRGNGMKIHKVIPVHSLPRAFLKRRMETRLIEVAKNTLEKALKNKTKQKQ